MQPDERNARLFEKRQIPGLDNRASAERNDARLLLAGSFTDDASELLAFDLSKFGLAAFGEDVGDGLVCGFDDTLIEIDVEPADLAGKQSRNGGLAAAHESRKTDECLSADVIHNCFERNAGEVGLQSRFRILIVPSNELSSTLARPALKVPNRLLPKRL